MAPLQHLFAWIVLLQRKKHNGKETQICPLQNLFAWITE